MTSILSTAAIILAGASAILSIFTLFFFVLRNQASKTDTNLLTTVVDLNKELADTIIRSQRRTEAASRKAGNTHADTDDALTREAMSHLHRKT